MKFLDHFSRITSGQRVFIPQIDGLRFVAILSVIAYHIQQICLFHFSAIGVQSDPVNAMLSVGHYGVELFFAISGFILGLPFARAYLGDGKRVELPKYYMRRVTRIEPPYVIHLLILALYCALVLRWQPAHVHLYHHLDWASYAGAHLLASLFYSNGFIFRTHPYPNIVLWSLEVEVQFYLLAPFISWFFKIPGAWPRRSLMIALILFGSMLGPVFHVLGDYRVGFSFLGMFQFFIVGFLLADLDVRPLFKRGEEWGWDLVFPIGIATIVLLRHWTWTPMFMPWFAFLAFIAAFRGVLTSRFLGLQWVSAIGGMCYTIYMYHWIMISMLVRVTGGLRTHVLWLDMLIQLALMPVIIIGVCSVLFLLTERPFMRRDWPARLRDFVVSMVRR